MIMLDKKKAMQTIMARRHEKNGEVKEAMVKPSEVKSEEGESDPRHEAARDILAAMQDKHPAKLMEAMAAFHDLHSMHKNKAEAAEPKAE